MESDHAVCEREFHVKRPVTQDQQGRLTQQRKQRSRGQHTFRMWSRLRQLFSRLRFLLVYIVTNRSVLPPRPRRQTHTHPVTLQLHSLDVVSYCCGCRTIHPCPCVCVWACQDDGCCGVGQNCSATLLTASPSCAADVDEILQLLTSSSTVRISVNRSVIQYYSVRVCI